MSNPFAVGDVVVCVDDSPWAKVGEKVLAVDKLYEVTGADAHNVSVKGIAGWKPSRFRRAKVYELWRFRVREGLEKHQFMVGDIVVGIADDDVHLGKTFEVSSVYKDSRDGECFVGLDGDSFAGIGAYRFRKATPEEAAEFLKKPKVATFTAGEDLKEGQLVTIQIGDGKPFKAVLLDKPVGAVNGKFTVPAELTLSVSFEWEGPEPVKAPVTRPACAESITEAPKPKWSPKVGDWVKVKRPFVKHWLDNWPLWVTEMDKYDGLVAQVQSIVRGDRVRFEEPKGGSPSDWIGGAFYYHFDWLEPAQAPEGTEAQKPEWSPKVGDIIVCENSSNSNAKLCGGQAYAVAGVEAEKQRVGLVGIKEVSGWDISRFRPATQDEARAYRRGLRRAEGPGEGYRFMAPEELVVEGDEFDNEDGLRTTADKPSWTRSEYWQNEGREQMKGVQYRRRNQFAEGELVKIVKPLAEEQRKHPKWVGRMDSLDGRVFEMPKTRESGFRPIIDVPDEMWTVAVDWLAPASTEDTILFWAKKAQKEAEAAKREPTKTEHLLAQRVEILAERLRESLIVIKALHTAIGEIGGAFTTYSDKSQGIVDEATEAYEDLTESLAEDFPEFFHLEESEESEDGDEEQS
jgi:hypothetical protein